MLVPPQQAVVARAGHQGIHQIHPIMISQSISGGCVGESTPGDRDTDGKGKHSQPQFHSTFQVSGAGLGREVGCKERKREHASPLHGAPGSVQRVACVVVWWVCGRLFHPNLLPAACEAQHSTGENFSIAVGHKNNTTPIRPARRCLGVK